MTLVVKNKQQTDTKTIRSRRSVVTA